MVCRKRVGKTITELAVWNVNKEQCVCFATKHNLWGISAADIVLESPNYEFSFWNLYNESLVSQWLHSWNSPCMRYVYVSMWHWCTIMPWCAWINKVYSSLVCVCSVCRLPILLYLLPGWNSSASVSIMTYYLNFPDFWDRASSWS